MPKFRVTCLATATIEETWIVEADSAQQAQERLEDSHTGFLTFESEEVIGDETDRRVDGVEEVEGE